MSKGMLRALVVDDEEGPRRRLTALLGDLGAAVTMQAATARDALGVLDHSRVDVAFLDVRLPEVDGLALGDRMCRRGVPVVFVTGFADFAVPAFEVGAVDYLMKPVSRERLGRALARVAELREARGPPGVDRLFLRDGRERVAIPARTVIYAGRDGEITTVECEQRSVRIREPLDRLERVLLPMGFFRCHRAYLVNLRRVVRIIPWSSDAQSLLLDDSKETLIPLAKSRVGALRSVTLWP